LVPSPDKLEISSVTGEFIGEAVIHVYTTQTVDDAGIKKLITLDPKTAITTEQTENGFYIKGAFASGKSYSLEIKKALKGLLGGEMENDYKAQVSFGQMSPSVSFANQNGIYLSTKSSKSVAINIVNIAKVHVKVYKVYEKTILFITSAMAAIRTIGIMRIMMKGRKWITGITTTCMTCSTSVMLSMTVYMKQRILAIFTVLPC